MTDESRQNVRAGLATRLFNEGHGPRAVARAAVIGFGFLLTTAFDRAGLFRTFRGRRLYYQIYAAGKTITDASKNALIRRFIRPGDICIDVGGAFGYFTRTASRAVGPAGKVLVLEPDPVGASFVRDLMKLPAHANVELRQIAAWDEQAELTLNLCAENRGENSLFASPIHDGKVVVQALPLDTLFRPDMPVSFVKMDIQGAEVRALRGMTGLLKGRDRVAVLVECSPDDLKMAGASAQEMIDLLLSCGLEIFRLDRHPMEPVYGTDGLRDLSASPFLQCDLLAVKGAEMPRA